MENWKKGYKVVQKFPKTYRSFAHKTGNLYRSKIYRLGKSTKRTRRDGPLAVFGTLTDAVRFVGCYGGGEYNNVICLCSYLESSDVTYWQNAPGHIQIQTSARGVRGKRFADAVVLLEEVWS